MRDDDLEKIMDEWAAHEIESASQMRPTAEMHRLVQARQTRRPSYLFSSRWAMTGAAMVGLIVLAILYAVLLQPSTPPSQKVAFVEQREGFPAEKGVDIRKGAATPSEKGSRGEPAAFSQLLFQFQHQDSRSVEAIDLQNPPTQILALTWADNYRLLMEPAQDRYVYVFQLTSSGALVQLFPNGTYSPTPNPLRRGQTYYLPSEPNWFFLDENTGTERLYVVASAAPIQDLEDLYDQYSQTEDEPGKQEMLSSLLAMLKARVEAPSEGTSGGVFTFDHR
jgi:hypothetical protein